VRAGVEEGANDTIIAARDQQGNTCETKRLEIPPFRDLALMANRMPLLAMKNALQFGVVNVLAYKNFLRNLIEIVRPVQI